MPKPTAAVPSFSVVPPLPNTLEANALYQHILALTEPQNGEHEQAVLYGLTAEPLYLSAANACRLLSLNEHGQLVRQNTTGNSVVTQLGKVFYKLYPTAWGIEYAVHSLQEALWPGLSAPTRLLAVHFKNTTYSVQASLAVEGVSLEALLWLAPGLERLETVMGTAALQQYLANPPPVDETLSLAQQYQQLGVWLSSTSADTLPLKFTGWQQKTSQQQANLLQDAQAMARGQSIGRLLSLLAQYPTLAEDLSWVELLHVGSVFTTVARVFPKADAATILTEAPQLVDKIDTEQFSAHLVTTLLTQPQDGKADNYIAQFTWDDQGRVKSIRLVSIDNDAAFVQPIVIPRNSTQHEVDVKSVIYTFSAALQQPIAQSVREALLRYTPEILLLHWLQGLYHYQHFYQSLHFSADLYRRILRPHDILRLLEQLTALQATLRQQPNLPLATLFANSEPLLARAYQALAQQHASPLETLAALYAPRQPVQLETLLQADLDQPLHPNQALTLRQALALEIYGRTQDEQRTGQVIDSLHYLVARIVPDALTAADQLVFWQCVGHLAQCQIYLPLRQPYWLEDTVLAALYEQYPAATVVLVKSYPLLQLRSVKQPQMSLNLEDARLLHYILPLAKDRPALLQVLLAAGAQVNGRNPANDDYTPLHLAARYNLHTLIPHLLSAGADSEAKLAPAAQGATPLDKAIQYRHREACRYLIQHGAGQDLQLTNGLTFLQDNQATDLALCQQLLHNCPRLAWQQTLLALTQTKAPGFQQRLAIAGIEKDNVRYLTTAAYEQLFQGREKITSHNRFGRHAVTQIAAQVYGLPFSVHIKDNPELPGREVMVSTLAEQLFGQGVPQVALLGLTKQQGIIFKEKITYPVLASRTIGSGKEQQDNLASVLAHTPERLQQLDAQSFSEAVILAMLTNPEDGKADNYVLEPFKANGEIRYRIVGVDNDHAFVRPFAAKSQGQRLQKDLQVKTILYCLDTMQAPIHSKTRQTLLELDTYAFLQQWLGTLATREQQHEAIFGSKGQQPTAIQKAIQIAFRPSIVRDLYQKLTRLQAALQRHPKLSHFELLRRVIPELGVCYLAAFQRGDNPQARFEQLTASLYERVIIEGTTQHRTVTNAMQVIEMTKDLSEPNEAEENLAAVRQRLADIHQLQSQLAAIRQEVQAGNLRRFLALPSIDQQAAIINGQGAALPGVDFSAMALADGKPDLKRQRIVLNALRNIPLRTLRLHGCAVLTDQDVALWLKTSPELRALSLSACPRLTDELLYLVTALCPQLEKLKLTQLNLQQPGNRLDLPRVGLLESSHKTPQPITLLALRELQIAACPSLTTLILNSPSLERLYLLHCIQLTQIATLSQQLTAVDLRGCSALTDAVMPPLASTWQHATWVKVSGTALHMQSWRECFPALNDFPWQKCSEQWLTQLEQGINQVLTERQLMLTPGMGLLLKPLIPSNEQKVILAMLLALQDANVEIRQAAAHALEAAIPLQPNTVISALLHALQDKDYLVRQAAAEALKAAIPVQPDSVISALLNALQDTDNDVCRAAAEALQAAIPLQPDTVIPALLLALQDTSEWVRCAAAKALKAAIPLQPASVIPALLNALQGRVLLVVCLAAFEALQAAIPLQPDSVIPTLLNALQNINSWLRQAAAEALTAAIPLQPDSVIPALLRALQDKNDGVRQAATTALAAAIPLQPDTVISALLFALQDEHDKVRQAAAEALKAAIPLQPHTVIPTLLLALHDESNMVRRAAAKALITAIPIRPDSVIPALLLVLQDTSERVLQAAAETLAAAIPLQPDTVIPALLNALQDKDYVVRQAASKALQTAIPLQPDSVIPALLQALQDKHDGVRQAAAYALAAAIPIRPDSVIPKLLLALQDKNDGVRQAAAYALQAAIPLQPDSVIPALLNVLQDTNYEVRQAAALVLKAAIPLQPATVIPALLHVLQDKEHEVRRNALDALAVAIPLQPAIVIPVLLHALQDNEEWVCHAASKALAAAIPLQPTTVIPALLDALQDKEKRVRQAAAEALKAAIPFQPDTVIPVLLSALQDKEISVRKTAISALSATFALQAADFTHLMHQALDKAGYPRVVANLPTSASQSPATQPTAATPAAVALLASPNDQPSSAQITTLVVTQQEQLWQFAETKVNHDGWCAVNAICQGDIQVSDLTFIAALKANLQVATVQQLITLSLRSCLENTPASNAQPSEFQQIRDKLTALGLAEEQRLNWLQKANTALGHTRAEDNLSLAALMQEPRVVKYHARLHAAEQQWQVCQTELASALQHANLPYLDFIAKDRYADENLLRAYLFTRQRCLTVVMDYGQGVTSLSQGLEIVNQPNWPVIYVVYRPGQNERTATYDQLTLLQGPVPLLPAAKMVTAVAVVPEPKQQVQQPQPEASQVAVSAATASAPIALPLPPAPPLAAGVAPNHDPAQRLLTLQREQVFAKFLKNVKRDFKARQFKAPTVFISYAWEADAPQTQALQARLQQLQADLQQLGMKVYLDITHIDGDMGHYMRTGIDVSDFVVLIGTPRLKQRLENPATNIALEWRCTQAKCQTNPKALIPLLFSGDFDNAFPPGIKQFLIRDFRNTAKYYLQMSQLADPLGLIPSLYSINQGEKSAKSYEQFVTLLELQLRDLEPIPVATPSSPPSPTGASAATLLQQSALFKAPPASAAQPTSAPTANPLPSALSAAATAKPAPSPNG